MKQQLEQLVVSALRRLPDAELTRAAELTDVIVERTRDARHGDFATNIALRLAKAAGRRPQDLAQAIIAALPPNALVSRAEVAGAGFINLFLARDVLAREVASIHELADRYGRASVGQGRPVRVVATSVERSPSEPLTVAQGRQAACIESLSNVLEAVGFRVLRDGTAVPAESIEVPLIRNVTVYRGSERAEGLTFSQLRSEVGDDACRFFLLMRSPEQALEFDIELAKSRTHQNPVYGVQYAHARMASVKKELAARGFALDAAAGLATLPRSSSEPAQSLMGILPRYAETLTQAAIDRAPHSIVYYLRGLANAFHSFYNAEKVIADDAEVRNARVVLGMAAAQVIRNGLGLLGVSAPESM